MQGPVRKLITLIAFAALLSAAGCKQHDSPADRPSSPRTGGAGTDRTDLAEAIVTLLVVASKRAQASGECDELKQRVDKRTSEERILKRLLCDRLARQKPKGGSSEHDAGSNAPKG